MRSQSSGKRYFVWLPLWVALGIAIGIFVGNGFSIFTSQKRHFGGANKLDAVMQYINEAYVDTVNMNTLIESALPQIIAELDPHSSYISAKDMIAIGNDLEGHFSGIGVQFVLRNDTIMVVNVIDGGPSQAAGILAGDRIVYVNDSLFAGKEITNDKVMKALRGAKDTDVKLGIRRPDVSEQVEVLVRRGDIPLNSVDATYQPAKNIGFIKINKFGLTTSQEFISAIARLKKQGSTAFIIDLRQNAGGSLTTVIEMLDEYLEKGELIVYTEGRAFKRENAVASGLGTSKKDQIVVLVDEGSASASEIFAGAIQDNDRGLVIGRRTFGKGLVQEQQKFADGSALRLTIARYYTASGRSLQKPYELGKSGDYNQDLLNRYLRGEFDSQDSIKHENEPVFHTKAGRLLHGNGGVMPDVFIPRDTTGVNSYYVSLINNGLVYEYAFMYTDKNRQKLLKFKDWKEMDAYLSYQPLMNSLVSFAESKGVRYRPHLVNESRKLLNQQLRANIIRNFFGDDAFYEVIYRDDIVVNKAIELIQNGKTTPEAVRREEYKK